MGFEIEERSYMTELETLRAQNDVLKRQLWWATKALQFVIDDCACDSPQHFDRAKETLDEIKRIGAE